MQLFGLIVMTIGSVGIVSATVMEIKTHEKIYALIMKIAPLIFAIGAGLFWGT
ncbi:unnamed protein product [marine sediment metagenome]|uniref:Uncharacterized protein n=1 Tax=marine sediment metagenome TaxID=412755 RepID=X1VWK0_9ZZZZ